MGRTSTTRADLTVARLAARQHGAISRRQALAAGLTRHQVDRRIASGRLVVLRRGVFAIAGAPASWHQVVMGSVLAGPPGTVACESTACRVWAFEPCPPDTGLHVLSPGSGRGRTPGVVGHRSTLIVPADLSRRSGVPVTSPSRTLVDSCGSLGVDDTGAALDDLLRRRIVTLDKVRATAARLAGPGRRKMRPIAEVLAQRAEGYELSDSDLEVRALTLLRRAGLALPVQQHRVVVGGRRYLLDLAYPEHLIAVELNGWEWHGRYRSGFDRTHDRQAALASAGWIVLPFTSETIDTLVARVLTLLPAP